MKILRLHLRNLNSLKGEWTVEFDKPPLADAGLFAITGPTGAGKTTLLDAITLALYGQAARYGGKASPEDVMSRLTGECSAEVDFQCASGTFRSTWSLHRARGKAAGKLQNPKRTVASLPGGDLLCERVDESNEKIRQLTGLDCDRFLRSVLLAQGDFAAFLKAGPRERTELLEQITGTGIYRDISMAAWRRSGDAQTALETLTCQQTGLALLEPDVRVAHERRRGVLDARVGEVQAELARLAGRVAMADRWRECRVHGEALAGDEAAWEAEQTRLASGLAALAMHERAVRLRPDLATLDQRTTQLAEVARDLATVTAALPKIAEELAAAEGKQCHAAEAAAMEQASRPALQALWDEVALLDQHVAAANAGWQQAHRSAAEAAVSAVKAGKEVSLAESALAAGTAAHAQTAGWLKEHAGDAGISALLEDFGTTIARWEGWETQASAAGTALRRGSTEIARLEKAAAAAAAKLAPLHSAVQAAQALEADLAAAMKAGTGGEEMTALELAREQCRDRFAAAEKLQALAARFREAGNAVNAQTQRCVKLDANAATSAAARVEAIAARAAAHRLAAALQSAYYLAERVQSIEAHRSVLEPDHACPLCGSLDHPWAGAEIPSPDVETARERFAEAEEELEAAQNALTQAEGEAVELAAQAKDARSGLARVESERAALDRSWTDAAAGIDPATAADRMEQARVEETRRTAQLAAARKAATEYGKAREATALAGAAALAAAAEHAKQSALVEQAIERLPALQSAVDEPRQLASLECARFSRIIAPFAPAASSPADAAVTLAALRSRAEAHTACEAEAARQLAEVEARRVRTDTLRAQATALQAAADVSGAAEDAARIARADREEARVAKFGTRAVAEARADADARATKVAAAAREAGTVVQRCREIHAQNSERREELARRQVQGLDHLELARATLERRAAAEGFPGMPALRAALLPDEDAQRFSEARDRQREQQVALATRRERLAQEQASLAPAAEADAASLPALHSSITQLGTEQTEANRALGQVGEILRQDDAARSREAELATEITAARHTFTRWSALKTLIGSGDGTLFARFAQSLTLERLVALANRHLLLLNPRYRVRRAPGDAAADLELEIVDFYQADASRPMRSLSGGESFLVSLALALGLSELASGDTAIESLFIDEGFGTLDADTLETAMAALETLQASRKTIGVISHVAAMQERILCQIQVRKESGGCSRIDVVG